VIRFIAAIDKKLGLANEHGIPWHGKVPTDVAQFRQKTIHGIVMMGYGWYQEQQRPLPDRRNLVAVPTDEILRPGFEHIRDARKFLETTKDDIWVGGGAALFASTIDLADELYLTHLDQDFNCTKFFPEYQEQFELINKSQPQTENNITFYFAMYRRRT